MHVILRRNGGATSCDVTHTTYLPAAKPPTDITKRATSVHSRTAARNGSVTSDVLRRATVCVLCVLRVHVCPAASNAGFDSLIGQ